MNTRKRVIYGLGEGYRNAQAELDGLSGDIYYCDRDDEKTNGKQNGITLSYLKEHIEEFDEIIITFGEVLKIGAAMESIGAKLEKYRLKTQVLEDKSLASFHFHGEEGIDAMVELALRRVGKEPGKITYIEIGTNDPINGNNSYHFYQCGSRGILVDPLPQSEIVSKAVRPKDCFRRVAVVAKRQASEIEFYINTDIASGISSIYADHHKNWGGQPPKKIIAPVITMEELFEYASFTPDALFIDAEGEDENLLMALPLNKYPIPVICVEVCDMTFERYLNVVEYMKKQGYSLYVTTSRRVNSIFIRNDSLN